MILDVQTGWEASSVTRRGAPIRRCRAQGSDQWADRVVGSSRHGGNAQGVWACIRHRCSSVSMYACGSVAWSRGDAAPGGARLGPAHGYTLSGELRRRRGGRLAIVEGSLYPALHRLEAARLVASSTEDIDGRRRRRYELTADGKAALKDEDALMGDLQGLRRRRVAGNPVSDDEQISRYLRRVRSVLRLPREQRRRAVEEIRNHLDDGAAAHMRNGATRHQAIGLAISELGQPDTVAAEFNDIGGLCFGRPCIGYPWLQGLCCSSLLSAEATWTNAAPRQVTNRQSAAS